MLARVISIPPLNEENDEILLHIKQSSSELYYEFVASDGEHAYKESVEINNLDSLLSANSKLSSQEWNATVSNTLFLLPIDAKYLKAAENVQLFVEPLEKQLEIIWKKKKDKIASIKLVKTSTPGSEIDLMWWVKTSNEMADKFAEQVYTIQQERHNAIQKASKMEEQLQELIEAKRTYEQDLLSKMVLLLNSKKAKIRDQQRLLMASSKPNSNLGRDSIKSSKSSKSSNSGVGMKRKPQIQDTTDDGEEDGDSSDAFEELSKTPDRDIETADEEDLDRSTSTKNATKWAKTKTGWGKRATRKDADTDADADAERNSDTHSDSDPPPRELPFVSSNTNNDNKNKTEVSAESETDDEL